MALDITSTCLLDQLFKLILFNNYDSVLPGRTTLLRKLGIFIGLLGLSLASPAKTFARALGYIDKIQQKYVVHSHFIFYGPKAKPSLVSKIMKELDHMWNQPKIVFTSGGKDYPMVFQFSYDLYDHNPEIKENRAFSSFIYSQPSYLSSSGYPSYFTESYLNEHPELNLVSIQKDDPLMDNRSSFVCGGQHGVFVVTDNLGSSTTVAHEYGHSLGLPHVEGAACRGTPSIMCMRGSETEPRFQYNPQAIPGDSSRGGILNPIYRQVTQDDVLAIKIHRIPKRADGSRVIGPHMAKTCSESKI